MNQDRARSLVLYDKRCPVTYHRHDWRMATDAPGWKLGDYCVRCENCKQKAIVPTRQDQKLSRV